MLSCFLSIVGSLVMAIAHNYDIIIVGRAIDGLGVGLGLAIGPLYMAELTPKELRGAVVTFSEIAINVGILLGYLSSFLLDPLPLNQGWRYMLGLAGIPPILIVLGLLFLPESPRWVLDHGSPEKARKILAMYVSPNKRKRKKEKKKGEEVKGNEITKKGRVELKIRKIRKKERREGK